MVAALTQLKPHCLPAAPSSEGHNGPGTAWDTRVLGSSGIVLLHLVPLLCSRGLISLALF